MKLITVTSPATDVGKTFMATGLAETASKMGKRVIYIDMDKAVGDSIRVLGIEQRKYPTVINYANHRIEEYARTKHGAYLLAKPDSAYDDFLAKDARKLLNFLKENFDLAIIDLGISIEAPYWGIFVQEADLAMLVTDCDNKALFRIQEFLKKAYCIPKNDWTLLINSREKRGIYTPRQMQRILESEEEIDKIFQVPYFSNIEKQNPKVFPIGETFAKALIDLAFSKENKNTLAEYEPNEDVVIGETFIYKEEELEQKDTISFL